MSRLSGDTWRCVLAWSGTLSMGVLLLAAIVVPLGNVDRGLQEEIDSQRDRLLRYQRVLAEVPALEQALVRVRGELDGRLFYTGQGATAVSTGLQQALKEVVERGGAQLVSTQALESEEKDGFLRVPVRAQMVGALADLVAVLDWVQQATPRLFVEQLRLQPLRARAIKGQPAKEPQLRLNLSLAAYLRPGEGA